MSGTPDFIAKPIASNLQIEHVVATRCATKNKRFLSAPPILHPFKEEKIRQGHSLSKHFNIPMMQTWAYSDSKCDIGLLEQTGVAVAVNPDRTLRNYAVVNGWEIMNS